MQAYRLTIRPQTAFGTPLVGDTWFGHICWGIAEQYGHDTLAACLCDYTAGRPFLIISDAFPAGYLPLPTLPSRYWQAGDEQDRKKLKKRQWLPQDALDRPLHEWQQHAKTSADIAAKIVEERQKKNPQQKKMKGEKNEKLVESHSQPHNSINRATGTTGEGGGFAPYDSEQTWYATDSRWQAYLLLDENRLSRAQLETVLNNIGASGYGRDASIGLGKYQTDALEPEPAGLFARSGNACLTLAPCCPQGLGYDSAHSYYQTVTRFGRHGNIQATAGNPYKSPILMAQTAAVISARPGQLYLGQGIGGISASLPATVHQGYAPIIAIEFDPTRLAPRRAP